MTSTTRVRMTNTTTSLILHSLWLVILCVMACSLEQAASKVVKRAYKEELCGPDAYYRQPTGVITSFNYPENYVVGSKCIQDMRIPYNGNYNVYFKVCDVELGCLTETNPYGGKDILYFQGGLTNDVSPMFCSTPDESIASFMYTDVKPYPPSVIFESPRMPEPDYRNGTGGFKVAYCMEDTDGISLRCCERSDFTCNSTNYLNDYVRYTNRTLSEWYDWAIVSTHEGPDPIPTSTDVMNADEISPFFSPDSHHHILGLIHGYNNASMDVEESHNQQSGFVDEMILVLQGNGSAMQQ